MSNWLKNTRTWLGLGDEPFGDEYGDPEFDEIGLGDEALDEMPAERPAARPAQRNPVRTQRPSVRSGAGASAEEWDESDGGVRVIGDRRAEPDSPVQRGVVRPLPTASKPHVVSPSGFNDVQQVADRFKIDQPVIINLQGVDRDLSRRLIDFASGLCYGLDGDMERVADQVFLLTPSGAEVSDDDRRRLREGGLVNDER